MVTRRVEDLDYEVARLDRGENKQIYHINLLTRWNNAVPVAFVTTLPEREELGPEVPTPGPLQDLSVSQGYYRQFVLHFSDLASPLKNLARKRAPGTVQWLEECQVSFEAIKTALCGEAVLCVPNFISLFPCRQTHRTGGWARS